MKRRLYVAAIWLAGTSALAQIGFFAWVYGSMLLATTVSVPESVRGLLALFLLGVYSLIEGLHVPLYPVLRQGLIGLIAGAAVAIVVIRRILIWQKFGSAQSPATYGRGGAVLFGICMASLVLAMVGLLAAPVLRVNHQIAHVFSLFGALLVPAVLSLPAKYLLGITLLFVELTSMGREGWWPPRDAPAGTSEDGAITQTSPRSPFGWVGALMARRNARITIMTAIVVIAVMASIWNVFPTGLIHEQLCRTRAGEHVYEKVRATSYLFVGEGASGDGLHLTQALEDVSYRRVNYIEVLKVPGNIHQVNSFGFLFGTHDPKWSAVRIAIGPAGSPDCLKLVRYYGEPEVLRPDECLRYVAVEKATSRYHVEAVTNQTATWFAPSIRSDGARVIDSERRVILGEDLMFANTSAIAFFVHGGRWMECPPRYSRKPANLHRKVLLGVE